VLHLGLDAAELVAAAPARRLRLPGKGRLEPGADADVVLVDPAGSWTVSPDTLLDRHKLSPVAGRTLRGRVMRTLLRGRTIALNGRATGEPCGRILRRQDTATRAARRASSSPDAPSA